MKILILCILTLSLQSCIFLPVAGITVTTCAAAVKYKWHQKETMCVEKFRAAVLNELSEINQKLEVLNKSENLKVN